ncbi:MAG TPA: DUF4398 domain-containing protein [Candidatus Binatia bacterium]|nr:DUF4398 domain-containing protein [Candidatus Binatia bacterium]
MATVGNTLKTSLSITLLLVGITTSAWGQVGSDRFPFSGELRGITQLRGSVVCVGCSLEEVQAARPHLTDLYEFRHEQGWIVMEVDTINERARWQDILGLSHKITVQAPDRLFQRLTAEENLFREVEIVGLLRNTRTLDIGNVTIFGPSVAEQAPAVGEQTQAAGARAEVAARRAETAADQAEMFADQAERTAQRIDAHEAARASVAYLPPYPPIELRLAREELDSARLALDLREYERARRLAEQALADARLAEVRAGTESARQAARDLRLSIETLRNEAMRLAALY